MIYNELVINHNQEVQIMSKIFYARCSTEEQNEARQMTAAKELNADKIFLDKLSGKDTNRPQLKAMLDYVREGDMVVCSDISRIARNTKDLLNIVEKLKEKNVTFVSQKENIDTSTATGQFMLTVFGAMAELERETILQRQREGIEEAKKAGKYKGRKPIEINMDEWERLYRKWKAGQITAVDFQKKMKLTAPTFYRKVKEYEQSK